MSATTRICRSCAEEIQAAARVCPHCCQSQSFPWSKSPLLAVPAGLLAFFVTLAVLSPGKAVFTPGAEFADHVAEVVVRESSFTFGDCGECKGSRQVTTVGVLENRGEHGWKNLHFEVRYLDAAGELIDAVSSKEYAMVLSAGGETAFRVKGPAARPRDAYASHQVIVKHAEDLAAWP